MAVEESAMAVGASPMAAEASPMAVEASPMAARHHQSLISSISSIFIDFHGFGLVQGLEVFQPVAAVGSGVVALKEDCRLQSCRFGGLEAWNLQACRLAGLKACRLAG